MKHGDRLLAVLATAKRSVFIASPFIKVRAFSQLLGAIQPEVTEIVCVTRWIPEEIASGVSDLEVYDQIRGRAGARLLLHPRLHAKLYRADARFLTGSANVTDKALGWVSPANLELLLDPGPDVLEAESLEARLRRDGMEVDGSVLSSMRAAVDALLASRPEQGNVTLDASPANWIPRCPNPGGLWNVYASHEAWRLVASAEDAARKDLQQLEIPRGLARASFEKYVGALITGFPLIQEIDSLSRRGVSDQEAISVITQAVGGQELPYGPAQAWEIVKAWLEHFLPGVYRRTPVGELWTRGRELNH